MFLTPFLNMKNATWIVPPLLAMIGCGSAPEPADLVLLGGRIVTLDGAKPQAEALAARGETIAAVGANEEIERLIGPATQVIRLNGALAIPGFIESHGHLLSLGRLRMNLDFTKARSWDEVVAQVREAASKAKPGEWILGRGWHQEKWQRPPLPSVEGYPTHEALSKTSPQNPVLLRHASGHAAIANSMALEAGRITAASPDPEGGRILRDSSGRLTGVLLENAVDPVAKSMEDARGRRPPEEIEAEARRAIDLAQQECLAKGVTSFQDAGSSFETIDRLRKMALEGRLGLRLWVMIHEGNEAILNHQSDYPIVGLANRHLTVRAIKKYMDGALGSRGAWLLKPYADDPSSTGLNTDPVAEIEETARLAITNGFQLCVHAIGDRANHETLDLYERVFRAHPGKKDLRWRVEHAQILSAADIPRFASLGVIASMQGIHCTSDAPWAIERLGPKRAEEGAYAWRKLLDSGAIVANGTDVPVEDVDPIANFYASVTRRTAGGTAFFPEQRMTREEALRSYTRNAAYAAFEEDVKGSLVPGKLADVTVLSCDILTVPDEEIRGARVLYTIVGGKVVYRLGDARL